MSLWAIIPAKDPWQAKSRLAEILTSEQRYILSLRLLEHTLEVVAAVPAIARCLVVSESEEALALAARHGALALPEPAREEQGAGATARRPRRQPNAALDQSLNAALTHAAEIAVEGGATALLALSADLPLLKPRDLRGLLGWLPGETGAVVVPDRFLSGTNALLMRPPLALPFQFGPDSLERHRRVGRVHGVPVVTWSSPGLRTDLDTAEDFLLARERGGNDALLRDPRLAPEPGWGPDGNRGRPALVQPGGRTAEIGEAPDGAPIDFRAAARRLRGPGATMDGR